MAARAPFCAAADWGTTSLRVWLLAADGEVLDMIRSDAGMSTLDPGEFGPVLEAALAQLGAPGDVPAIICGMAGAAQGWVEAAYVDVPTSTDVLAAHAVAVPGAARATYIVPGLAQRDRSAPDVMRGEETLLLGAIETADVDGLVCLPGTHAKWATIANRQITGFHTAMTGEVFALLSRQSTLAHFLDPGQDVAGHPAFAAAVAEALAAPARFLRALFSLRAEPLLFGRNDAAAGPARLSGLLIGLELAGQALAPDTSVALIADGPMAEAYAAALGVSGVRAQRLSAEKMALAGLYHIATALIEGAHPP